MSNSKHLVLVKLCVINELYLTDEVSAVCEYLKGLEISYKNHGYHSFRIEKLGSTFWLFGSKVDMDRNENGF
ncbi:MAG: hypothetical protein MUO60_17825 [Clostridiaceae bacterium]|nr:hypothetical protein [Clostridiaceae bacterium]